MSFGVDKEGNREEIREGHVVSCRVVSEKDEEVYKRLAKGVGSQVRAR
jgi:hypothetical protein